MTLNPQILNLFGLPRLVELRWLSAPCTFSLFTDSLGPIEEAFTDARLSGLDTYLVINPPRPEVLDKRNVQRDVVSRPTKGQCCADVDVPEHVRLPFDFDPNRAVGTASTEAQRSLALKQRDLQDEYLAKMGLPGSVAVVDSGNGVHDYRRTSLPNTDDTAFKLTALYACLGRKFGTPEVIFDKSVRSPAQLMRFPGSFNHKANRSSSFLHFDESPGIVTIDMIDAVITDLRGQLGFKRPLVARTGPWTLELMEKFLAFHEMDYLPPVEIPQGLLYVLNPCPLNFDHVGSSPAVLVTKAGWAKFCCKHQSCGGGALSWDRFCARLFARNGKFFLMPSGRSCDAK